MGRPVFPQIYPTSVRTLGLCVVLAGCGDDGGSGPMPASDGGPITFVDGGPPPDTPDAGDAGRPPRDDAGPASCEPGECDPRIPDGDACAPPDRCLLLAEAPACAPPGGAAGPGAVCRELDGCAPGLACVDRRGGATCAPVCCPGAGDCAEGERCASVAILVDGTAADWGICTPPRPCDPLAAEAVCEPGEGCYVADGEGATDCRAAGTMAIGAPCAVQQDCRPGAFCAGRPGEARCAALCALPAEGGSEDGPGCPSDQRCAALAATPEGVGLCVPRE